MSEHKKVDVILAARDQLFHEAIATQGCISVSYQWPCSDGRTAQLKLELIEGEKKDEQPAIDAVPVVRCKDCMYLEEEIPDTLWYCSVHEDNSDLDDFCNYGKRKEADAHG